MFNNATEFLKLKKEFKHVSYNYLTNALCTLLNKPELNLEMKQFPGGCFLILHDESPATYREVIEAIGRMQPDECWFEESNTLRLWWD